MTTELWEFVESPSRYTDYFWYSDDIPARKFYRFLAEIGQRMRHLMTDTGAINMIDFCEQCAEGEITEDELSDLSEEHRPDPSLQSYSTDVADYLYFWVADRYKVNNRSFYYAASALAAQVAVEVGLLSEAHSREDVEALQQQPEFTALCDRIALEWGMIIRDIYGPNPFHLPVFDPVWRTSNVMRIANRIYDEEAFHAMPRLADALEQAGCDNEEILSHCRGSGPHVRGCWVVDLVLNKG